MKILLDRERVQWAIDELNSETYNRRFFQDPIAQQTRDHLLTVLKLYLEQGPQGLERTYRGLGSASLMLGLFLLSASIDPLLDKSAHRVYSELYRQWGEFPYYNGLMFGFALLSVLRKKYVKHSELQILIAAEKMLGEFCADGLADRGLTCFWILLRGYAKGAIV